MKWFKHETKAHEGKIVQHVFKRFGLEGEARYWRLVAFLAYKYPPDKKGFYSFSIDTIREQLRHRSTNDCRSFLDHLATYQPPFVERSRTKELFMVDYSGNYCQIKYDKIAEIKDNHTSNLQATNKKLTSNLQADKRRVDKNKKREDSDGSTCSLHEGNKKPNAVIVADEFFRLVRAHSSDLALSLEASEALKKVFLIHPIHKLRSSSDFETKTFIREALKAGA